MFAAALLCVCVIAEKRSQGQTTGPCGQNVIVCENQNAGAPSSEWDVNPGDTSIQGFATQISVIAGQTQQFKVETSAAGFTVDIYRMGYYGGMGARKINTATIPTTRTNQPACMSNGTTGLIDCGNWNLSASWTVPSSAVSGIYFARLKRNDTGGASHAFFIVRESDTAPNHSDMLFQTSDTTWQAYNQYGGNSLYVGSPAGRAYKVSYNRPITSRADTSGQDSPFNAEYPMVRFLEANGYDVSYISGVDTDRSGSLLLQHKVFMSVGHDEYWSGGQRTNVEAARAAGVHLAFFSGNEVFWKTRWENSIDGSNTPYKTLVCYKETHANAVIDPQDPPTWTGTWGDPRFSPPADGGRPQNALTGQMFGVNDGDTTAISIPAALGKHRFWRNTSVATLATGTTATLPNGTLGYEWDIDVNNGFLPSRLMRLSQTTKAVAGKLLDYGSTFGAGTVTHALTLYKTSSGALVFGAGTVQWSWGLDAEHDRGSTAADVRMKQATVNLFADMGVQAATLQSGLVATTASSDLTAPSSTITSPASGATVTAGAPVTISGTAVDTGGGIVSGVEVSTDGGTTWRAATGTTSWSFAWTAAGSGSVTIRSRAYDDSGNLETPTAGVTITVNLSRTCPCSIWASTVVPPAPIDDGDTASVELGDRIRSDVNGYITAIRFYKGSTNTGTHTGSLWTNTGALLASVTFSGETASGWQQANLPNAVAITANTTYVVSYHAPNGHYTGTDSFFVSAGVDNAPLHALQTGVDGPSGVYSYGTTSAFPTNTFQGENYWVDVVFSTTPPVDSTPPTVTATVPVANALTIDPNAAVTATFSEAMDPNTISSSTTGEGGGSSLGTFELRDPSNNLVGAAVTYDAATRTAKLQPNAALLVSTRYTATIKGGATDPRVKDLAGNALAANMTWSFTTAAAPPPPPTCPCTIWLPTAVPNPIDDNDPSSSELGTKFRSDVTGYITGARFYKGTANTGTHTASLWSSTGTKLASATFSGESASGWQQVSFPTPVQIAANTTYVISYHAPNGHYPAPDNYFAANGVDNPPLHALRDGVDGPNGVYAYGATSTFPNQTFMSEGYFVDVVFNTSIGPDVTPPQVNIAVPAAGASGINVNATVSATFNEVLNASTVTTSTFVLRDDASNIVPATVTYSASTLTATLTPGSALTYSTQYTATLTSGVKDLAGNALANYTWPFTTSAPPPPPPSQGPGGPILVVTSTANPFTTYLAEIVRGEGANEFLTLDVSQVTSTTLDSYDVVVLGDMSLTTAQVTMFTNWVNAGGNLIAMRPDKKLASLMGLTDAALTLADAYLLVNTSAAPGAGIVNQTIQFHGTADRYTLNGATSVATLYSNATTATTNPAVTMRSAGLGHAVSFTYDLARSVVYTRQGNPLWAEQERDGQNPIRTDDLFFGAKSGDVKPDYVDLNKVAIPQADEQQRLLWNIVLNVNSNKKPLPRFWYFPRMLPAAVIMTGDDHANNGTAGRFNDFNAASTANCNAANWECIRGTSYIYPGTPISDSAVANYVAQGFEVALHVNTNCGNWSSPAGLESFYATQLSQFASAWPHAGNPRTNRTHCIVWSDWSTQAQIELNHGIRLDTNYYYWPDVWILDRPGMFTGSGMPQRFADQTGQMIDVYQAATQMTDESGQTFPKNVDTLLNNAIGATGYYGMFTANMHTDANNGSNSETWALAIVNSAKARNIPVITAKQALEWLDGRNGSSFQSIAWTGNVLTFNVAVGAGANGLRALVPASVNGSPITGVLFNGSTLSYTTQTIKGIQYDIFAAAGGAYQVSYGADVFPPTIGAINIAPTSTTAVVTWTTNEASTSLVSYGTTSSSLTQTATSPGSVLSHSVTLAGLTPNTTYFLRVSSTDGAGNQATSPATGSSPLPFTTLALSISGTVSPSQFGGGVTITVSGPLSPITSTNGTGNYTVPGLPSGTYTITPSKTGYTFVPTSQSVPLTTTDATGVNFSAQPVVISGTITPQASGNNATVTLAGTMNAVVNADSSGNYSFTGVPNGSYTVSVSNTGFTFTPPSQPVTIAGSLSATGVNFTGQPIPTWTISGTVTGGGSATVSLTGAATKTATADGSGNYSFTGLLDGSYTVTPTKSGYTMSPASQPVSVSGANVANVNFTAQPIPTYSISGTISPTPLGAGATVTLSGGATGTTTTDASGNYSFGGLLNGTYTVAPTKTGVIMTPTSRAVTISNANVGAVNFTASAPALSIDASVSTGRSTKATTIASPAFTTTAGNELILAFVAMDDANANGITVTGVSGAGLTWTLVRRTNTSRGGSEIWRAFAPSVLTGVTATATLSQNIAAAITIVTFKGVDTTGTNGSGAIGATASGSAASGGPTASLTTTRAGSLVIGVGNDWDSDTSRTLGPNQTLVSQFLATVGDTFWVQRTSTTITAAGTVVTINDTAPTGDQYNLTICEVLSGS